MGYQDSDVLLFFLILGVIIFIFGKKKNPGSSVPPPPPPAQARQEEAAPPQDSSRSAGMEQREMPAGETQQFADAGAVKGLFVVVTADDAQTQLMAMSLSTQVKQKGKSVRILLCDDAGDLAMKGSKEVVLKPIDKSPQMLMKNLISQGVTVEVCPFFLANKTFGSPADLIDGVAIAKPPEVADALLEPGIKLFTF
ncbi:MAG: hypothetical protein V2I97_07490 [Desulfococcaceae bacterium]|jgi:predicted peroxiredoxin|nr:hypothetical protein [Desulfococcaceae bacterium]